MSELKPCPFCGSPAYSYHDNCIDFAGVKCDLGGCVCADILITENNWNTRPIEDALNARIAELETENAALKAEISKLKAPQGWIDVKKQMPDVPIALVAWKDGSIKLDSTFTDGGRDYWYHSGLDNVAYWMPIPEPPEVKE